MSTLSEGAIVGISFAACCVPCIIVAIGSILSFYCCYFNIPHYMIVFVVILFTVIASCIGIICLMIFLIFIFTANNITETSLSLIYCIFLIIPCCCLLVFYGYIYIQTDWKHAAYIKQQQKTDKEINYQLQNEKRMKFNQKTLLLMGNSIKTTQILFDNLRMINGNKLAFYKHIMLKYLIKNLQSLIIITTNTYNNCNNKDKKQNNAFLKILSTPTHGKTFLTKDSKVMNNIISVWNNENIQNTLNALQDLQSGNTNINTSEINGDDDEKYLIDIDNNIVHKEFIEYFMNRKDIKNFKNFALNDNDIEILLKEHEFYQKKIYFGNDKYAIWTAKHPQRYFIEFHGAQNENEWIKVFLFDCDDNLDCIIYVIDLSIFEDKNNEFLSVIRFWLLECFDDRTYIPIDVEMTINRYIANESMLIDIQRYDQLFSHQYQHVMHDQLFIHQYQHVHNYGLIILLFVNYDSFRNTIDKYGVNALKSFFPNNDGNEYLVIDNNKDMYDSVLQEIKDLYTANYENDMKKYHLTIEDLNDVEEIGKIFEVVHEIVIHNQLQNAGLM